MRQGYQVTNKILQYAHLCSLVILAATMAASATYRLSLASRQQVLPHQIADLDRGIERLKREYKEVGRVGIGAIGLGNAGHREDGAMTEMLHECKSREEFVVRDGPRIAWSELSGSTNRSMSIGIYVPAGRHWLRYAVGLGEDFGGVGYQRFYHGDPRAIAGAVSVELAAEPEVYEVRLNISDEKLLKIEVLGRDNTRIHEQALPQRSRGTIFNFNKAIIGGFAFPGEFKPNADERPYFLKPALPPITDLGALQGAAKIRLWIESDARPCMPAIYVAANYQKVTSLRYRHDNPPRIDRVTDADTEFNRLFESYDGSCRFYFREGIFRQGSAKELLPYLRHGSVVPSR